MKNRDLPVKIFFLMICILAAAFTLTPFFFMIISSFKPGQELMRNGINLNLDSSIMSLQNYMLLATENGGIYYKWYFNSIVITLIQTAVVLIFSAMVGYALAVYNFKGKNAILLMVMVVMMVPVEILLLPLYKLIVGMRLYNSYAGVILPYAVSPFAIFFFRQYAAGLPKDFMGAARIDGCGEFRIFWQVMLPLMKPAVGAMTILQAMGSWNSFVWPMVVMGEKGKMTLPVGLSTMITPYGNNYDMLMPGAVLAVIPIALIFIFNQKAFIDGMTAGGVKG